MYLVCKIHLKEYLLQKKLYPLKKNKKLMLQKRYSPNKFLDISGMVLVYGGVYDVVPMLYQQCCVGVVYVVIQRCVNLVPTL